MNRDEMLNRVRRGEGKIWDIIVIGGGATGAGCALDAAARGFSVLLAEQNDFGKGTSSRSTKLVHGGVRYLARGNISLVREALKERGILLENAPRSVVKQEFIVPVYTFRDKIFYGAGLKIYDLLAGKYSFGKSRILSREATLEKLPNIRRENLRGGISYFDGQLDDALLLIDLMKTAALQGATVLNYTEVFELKKTAAGKICGVKFRDLESKEEFAAEAKVVINATGAFCDSVRTLSDARNEKIIAPSQGIHLVFDREFLPSETALLIPKISDGRVLFAIPWGGKTLIGTTDTPVESVSLEPLALEEEIEFVLATARNYLAAAPRREDIKSVFAGIRPLVKSSKNQKTAQLARDHTIEIDDSNLLTVTGGKWTTYRKMAEDAINQAQKIGDLPAANCVTENLKIDDSREIEIRKLIAENPQFGEKLGEKPLYRIAEIIYAVRFEMARTVEDILARRMRILFLDAAFALELAAPTAEILTRELGKNENWKKAQIAAFNETARHYLAD